MNRDHLLGWPAALLTLDPEPRVSRRTPVRPPITAEEAAQRRALDVEPKAAPKFVPEYFRGDSGWLYRTTDGPPTAFAERFDKLTSRWIPCESLTNERMHTHARIHPIIRLEEIPE